MDANTVIKGKAGAALATISGMLASAAAVVALIPPELIDWGAEDPYVEFSKHFDEEPTEFMLDTGDGIASVAYYSSDGCFLLDPPGADARWVTRRDMASGGSSLEIIRPVLAGFVPQSEGCLTEGCVAVHPGAPSDTWIGETVEVDGEVWTQVFREWDDGCVHFQLRRDDGAWNVEGDGKTPRVCWQRCVH